MFLPGRDSVYAQFINDYETIRKAEGRGAPDPAYYRSLPFHNHPDWRIRAATFKMFQPTLPATPQRILDLGAGNGWLSHRLAALGHQLMAIDLTVNAFDGLGCWRFYEPPFTPIQAEFDHLPCPNASQEYVIFNASLHYATDYLVTLGEALRTLTPTGKIIILDSPVYHQAQSGEQMVREREAAFRARYGMASNALASQNFLTYTQLAALCQALGLEMQIRTPFYGLRWWLRPWRARLTGHREPANFHLIALTRKP